MFRLCQEIQTLEQAPSVEIQMSTVIFVVVRYIVEP